MEETPVIRIPTTVLRAEYKQVRERSHCEDRKLFTHLVKTWLAEHKLDETPENFVAAAKVVPIPCRRCAGTGRFITGMTNGQPTGPGGICFRCSGKSYQDDSDARRNHGFDRHQRVY